MKYSVSNMLQYYRTHEAILLFYRSYLMSVTVPAVTCGLIPGRRFVYELATSFPLSLNLRFAYFTSERVAFTLSELTPFSTTPQLQLYCRSTTPRASPRVK